MTTKTQANKRRRPARTDAGEAPRERARVPARAPADQHPRPAAGWVQYIGSATLLLHFGPFTLLTDPNLVRRGAEVPVGFGHTSRRLTDPAVDVDELPRPDAVIVSHDHGDHFDAVAADWLERDVPIVTAPGAAPGLGARGFTRVRGLGTWESAELEKDGARLRVTAVPARHGPGPLASALPDVMGSVLEFWTDASAAADSPPQLRIYLSGDTVFHDELGKLRDRFGDLDVAFLHLGGTRVMGLTVTMDAAQGVQLINLLQPRLAIPVHYDDYGTARSTLAEFVAAVNQAGLADRVRYLRRGDAWPLVTAR